MARRITAFLISIVLVFSLAVISFADQTPAIYDLTSSVAVYVRDINNTSTVRYSDVSNVVFDWDNYLYYQISPWPNTGYSISGDQVSVTFTGYTDIGLSDPFFYTITRDATTNNWSSPVRVPLVYDSETGFFSFSYTQYNSLSIPFIYVLSDCPSSFVDVRSCIATVLSDTSDTISSFEPILAITANTDYSGTIDLPVVRNSKSQRFQPIFHNPLEKGVTYLVTLSLSSYPYDIASDNVSGLNKVFDDVLITGVFNGGLSNTPGYAIPFTTSVVFPSFTDNLTSSGQHAWPFNTATQTVSFFYTPTANDSDPFYFSVTHNNQVKETFSALIDVQALPVVGVQLDDVQENQSFAAWLNNKLDSLFGGLFGRLQSNFNSEDQAYEDAADDAVDEGLGQVEQEHEREEELTEEAISNLNESLNAVELPDLTQQQEINSGIGLLNTVIFDGFFGNPQMRFLLIFSLGMALAAVVLRLNH